MSPTFLSLIDKHVSDPRAREALLRMHSDALASEARWRTRAIAVAEALEAAEACEEHRPCGLCREKIRAAFAVEPGEDLLPALRALAFLRLDDAIPGVCESTAEGAGEPAEPDLAAIDRAIAEASGLREAAEKAIRRFRDFGEGLSQPFGGRSRRVITAGQVLVGMADRELAALAASPEPRKVRE
jgi:hypothetical protein